MGLLERLNNKDKVETINETHKKSKNIKDKSSHTKTFQANIPNYTDKNQELKNRLHRKILKMLENESVELIISKIDEMTIEIVNEDKLFFKDVDRKNIVEELKNNLTGYGPINPLLLDNDISEIMVNGPNKVYAEKNGRLQLTNIKFKDNEQVMQVIEKIVSPLGRRIDESSPMVDARLPDGSRVNAIIPPLSLNGPTITIRKFSEEPLTVEDLQSFGTLTREMSVFLDACVKAKLNIFISGGTGSGKTTTLNVISSFIPNEERIITIEDAAELKLWQEHVVSLESRPANIEGKGEIAIRDLVKNSLRMRPDRIIVGEVRGSEALDMLQAMNTGHDGSLATGHSNSPRDMVSRLETMVLMAGIELPIKAIRQQISSAIDIIIQQSRLKDGTRKITNITEVQGLESDVVVLQDIFIFKQSGVDGNGKLIGKFMPTGVRPKLYEKIIENGINIPIDIFANREDSVI